MDLRRLGCAGRLSRLDGKTANLANRSFGPWKRPIRDWGSGGSHRVCWIHGRFLPPLICFFTVRANGYTRWTWQGVAAFLAHRVRSGRTGSGFRRVAVPAGPRSTGSRRREARYRPGSGARPGGGWREAVEQAPERDTGLQHRQRGVQAAVNAAPERKMALLPASDVEPIRGSRTRPGSDSPRRAGRSPSGLRAGACRPTPGLRARPAAATTSARRHRRPKKTLLLEADCGGPP